MQKKKKRRYILLIFYFKNKQYNRIYVKEINKMLYLFH